MAWGAVAPLKPAGDALLLDNSSQTVEESVAQVLRWWEAKQPFESVRIWAAEADDLDFRLKRWSVVASLAVAGQTESQSSASLTIPVSATKKTALLAEARYKIGNRAFTLSRPVTVIR